MMSQTLLGYYKTIFSLVHHYRYGIADLENLMVYELDIYLDLLKEDAKEQEDQLRTKEGIPI